MGKNTNSGARKRISRIYQMMSLISNYRAKGKKITSTDLKREYEVDRATINRDLEFIRGELSVELEWDPKEGTYNISHEQEYVPAMELSEKDYLLLEFIQQSLSQYSSTELGKEMMDTFQRLFGIFTGKQNWNDWNQSVVFRLGQKPATATREIRAFNIFHRAISKCRTVTFKYKSLNSSQPKEKLVEPHLMAMNEGRWYLYATDTKTRRLTSYAFPRISEIQELKDQFVTQPNPHPRDLFRHSFGCVVSSDPPFDVVIEFESEVVERVKESIWQDGQKIEDLADGRIRLSLRLNSELEILPWVLCWGPCAKVVAPSSLAKAVQEKAEQMATKYASS
jgi:predicted DNA-binding transcriptional regulator YafY